MNMAGTIIKQNCDNCRYFGGLMCAHVDENNKCLGWEKIKFAPIKTFKYRRLIRKTVRKMKNESNVSK